MAPVRHGLRQRGKDLLIVARPWVFFLWVPAMATGFMLADRAMAGVPSMSLFGLMLTAVFFAMLGQHFLHVAGGSSSTRSFDDTATLIYLAVVAGIPTVTITAYFTWLRGFQVLVLFLTGVGFVVGYSIPRIKSEWYWGLGQGVVTVVTYNVLTGALAYNVALAAIGVACLYHNMLHSARLAEGDYDGVITKRARGYYVQRYSFFVGATLLPAGFVV